MVPRVSDALANGAVILRPPWQSFEEAVHGLVDALVTTGQLPDSLQAQATHAVFEREAMGSTAVVEIGVSIPHARLAGVNGLVASFAVSPTAVYYALTEVPITIMALVLSAPAMTGEQLNFLSGLSMLLQSAATRRALQTAATPAQVLEYVRSQERGR